MEVSVKSGEGHTILTNLTRSITIAIHHHATTGSAIAEETSSREFWNVLLG